MLKRCKCDTFNILHLYSRLSLPVPAGFLGREVPKTSPKGSEGRRKGGGSGGRR